MGSKIKPFFLRSIVNQIVAIGLLSEILTQGYAKTIYLYCGPGVDPYSLYQLRDSLLLTAPSYKLECLDSKTFFSKNWEADAAILVMPGGADRYYARILNGEGNQRIRTFVEQGGSYLGICAGSYYAGAAIEFSKGNSDIEVIEDRELAFFPGLVRGPNLAPFTYGSNAGVRAAQLRWRTLETENASIPIAYNGGGYFVNAHTTANTQVLLEYEAQPFNEACCESPEGKAAIIECHVGKGIAILSAVHPEYAPCDLPLDPLLRDALCTYEEARLELLKELLKRLGI